MNFLKVMSKEQLALWLVVMVSLYIIAGCAGAKPYLEVGVGHSLDGTSSYYVQSKRAWTCDSPTAHFELGVEHPANWKLGYHHQSHWACGMPFNSKPEVWQDEIILTYKFGGL